ncbi:sensor histidine kinase [Streptomyces sp. NBC_01483]|uniref:sensor histidine kinase n=1 Tax=Streptomyces sp. NBC_01483 TaxID=2903883 RepID=UPI002E30D207|nr:ATP-binding protein [Streptomyces sp. NBC_01483]
MEATGIAVHQPGADLFRVCCHAAAGALFVLAGLMAHHRRPGNPVGVLMIAVGAGFYAEDLQLSAVPLVHTVGELTVAGSSGFLVHLTLAYPTGGLPSTPQRILVGVAYTAMVATGLLDALFMDWPKRYPGNAPGLLLIVDSPALVRLAVVGSQTMTVVIAGLVLVIMLRRWQSARPLMRSLLMPVIAVMLAGALTSAVGTTLNVDRPLHDSLLRVYDVVFIALPVGFLAGILRLYLGRSTVGRLLKQLPPDAVTAHQLEQLLIRVLHDPSLRIVTESTAGLGGAAQTTTVPCPWSTTPLQARPGTQAAWLVHDRLLHENQHVLDAVAKAAGLALVNQDLTDQLKRQLEEVRASRVRIVDAAETERRRIQHNLHDGAQQRLLTALAGIRLVQRKLAEGDPRALDLLETTAENLVAAHREIRELARGLPPEVLTEFGLTAAVQALAEQMPLPIAVKTSPTELPRMNARIESTAYFVTAEALTNALKHANAEQVTVELRWEKNQLNVRVADNGNGGADRTRGLGLVGLADRLAAADGELRVHSPPGSGTVIEAFLQTDNKE